MSLIVTMEIERTFDRTLTFQVGFYIDDGDPIVNLHAVRDAETEYRVSADGSDLDDFRQDLPWFNRLERLLELQFTPGRGFHVKDEIVKVLVKEGASVVATVSRALGRGKERAGVMWFPCPITVSVGYDAMGTVGNGSVGPAIHDLGEGYLSILDVMLSGGRDYNWVISWVSLAGLKGEEGGSQSLRISQEDGVIHAEVSSTGSDGYFGSSCRSIPHTTSIRRIKKAIKVASSKSMKDLTRVRSADQPELEFTIEEGTPKRKF